MLKAMKIQLLNFTLINFTLLLSRELIGIELYRYIKIKIYQPHFKFIVQTIKLYKTGRRLAGSKFYIKFNLEKHAEKVMKSEREFIRLLNDLHIIHIKWLK